MSIYLNSFPRSSTGASFSFYCITHRRFYADRKSSTNHYDALGINANASPKEIKTAFYKLSKKHHPDVNPDDKHAANKFSTISNAYDILGDPIKRRDYDNELSSQTSTSDPYVTYDRTTRYAQRARAHRPSSWKPPPQSSNSSGGFKELKMPLEIVEVQITEHLIKNSMIQHLADIGVQHHRDDRIYMILMNFIVLIIVILKVVKHK
jgi:hypothetical protein